MDKNKTIMNMRQEEVVNEIRRMCGQAVRMQSLGWHFRYNGQAYFYVVGKDVGKDESMLRFCIPFVTGICSHERQRLKEAVDETNRNVKFVKAMLAEEDEAKVFLGYDHKITDNESAKDIVPHIIKALDFAVGYLEERTN